MTHMMSVIPHHNPWLHEHDPAARSWRAEVQDARGGRSAPNCVPGSLWPGAEEEYALGEPVIRMGQ